MYGYQPELDEQHGEPRGPHAAEPVDRLAGQVVDQAEVGVEHVPPDQQHRERRHGVRQDDEQPVEPQRAEPRRVQRDRHQQACRERRDDGEDGEREVPAEDAEERPGDRGVGERPGVVAEADVDLPPLGQGHARGVDEAAP
jgi:hypothetical protein